jgi:hypothetical protein
MGKAHMSKKKKKKEEEEEERKKEYGESTNLLAVDVNLEVYLNYIIFS